MELHKMVNKELCEFFYGDGDGLNVTAPITETVDFIRDIPSEEDDTLSMLKGFLIGLSVYEGIGYSDMANTIRIVEECIIKMDNAKANMGYVDRVRDYLENYNHTVSNAKDELFRIFENDVSSMSDDYRKGELYVNSKEDYIDYIEEQMEDTGLEQEELKQLQQKTKLTSDVVVVITDVDGNINTLTKSDFE